MRRVVLASNNAGKLRELRAMLAPVRIEIVAQRELGIEAAEEPHATFIENALAKARHAALASGLAAIADDSGLCCEALGGAPGVRSARFAGPQASDAANNAELVRRLAGCRDRRAHFTCVLVAIRAADDPEPIIAEGRWHGEVLDIARGAGGFGYDPHFWLPQERATAGELPHEVKNRTSHRGQAMRDLLDRMTQRWADPS